MLLAVVALLLYGAVSDWQVGRLLLLVVGVRGAWLVREALRRPVRDGDWERRYGELTERYARLDPAELEAQAAALGVAGAPSPATLATAALAAARRAYVPPRAGGDLACEAVGLVAFALLIPAALALSTRPFVFAPSEWGWLPPAVAVASLGLYAWPLLRPASAIARRRALWWTLPAIPAAAVVLVGIARWHPYLNPLRPDREKLAAERVLSLRSNIVAGAYAGWVVAYARTLEAQGDAAHARWLYRESLRLDPQQEEARRRLTALAASDPTGTTAAAEPGPAPYRPGADPHLPLWAADDRLVPLARCRLDAGLAAVERTGVVIVRAGAVPDWLVDVVGTVLGRELSLPVCVAETAVILPDSTRVRGLLIGDQWSVQSLRQAFGQQPLPTSPVMYVVLTGVNIYEPGANFLFSRSHPWGPVVSFAQFGDADLPNLAVANRAAKAALGGLLKSFGVPMSPDVDCVTSYSKTLREFDAKGNRPSVASFGAYRRALVARDRRWAARQRSAQAP